MKTNQYMNMKKLASMMLCGALLVSLTACGSAQAKTGASGDAVVETALKTVPVGNSAASYESGDATKEETVYIFADAEGKTDHIVVSDWLKNTDGSQQLQDQTSLQDIENVKGDETYTAGAEDKITWESNGNDIYYQGTTTKQAPIQMDVSYQLDGKSISPQQLVGKSGQVTIRYTYTSTATQEIEVDNKKETVPVPFAVVTGMVLPTDQFTNVETEHAQIISDGTRQIVVGVAVPGLEECLAIDELADSLGQSTGRLSAVSNYFEVTANVTDFEMNETLTMVSADLDQLVSADDFGGSTLSDDMNTLDDSAQQLTDGTGELVSGITELSDGSQTLDSGMQTLIDGTATLKTGTYSLVTGTVSAKTGSNTLSTGAAELSKGFDTLVQGSSSLNEGASSVKDGASDLSGGINQLMDQAFSSVDENANLKSGSEALVNGADLLVAGYEGDGVNVGAVGGAQALASGLGDLQTAIESQSAEISLSDEQLATIGASAGAQASAAVGSEQASATLAALGITEDTEGYETYLTIMTGALQQTASSAASAGAQAGAQAVAAEASTQLGTTIATLDASVGALKTGADSLSTGVSSLYTGTLALQSGAVEVDSAVGSVQAGVSALQSGADQLSAGATSLADGASQLNEGMTTLGTGAGKLSDGAASLDEGVGKLADGAKQLDSGVETLQSGETALGEGTTSLVDGVAQLLSGSEELDEGMNQFKTEGIDELVSLSEDLTRFADRLEALSGEDSGYTNFSGITEGSVGSVKFVIRTEAIKES